MEREGQAYVGFFSVKHASATTLVIERARKYAVVLSCNGRGRRLASSSRRVVAAARRVSPPPPPPHSSPSFCRLTFFSAKVVSRASVFRSDDDDGDDDDDDDSSSGSGSDAVIQYGSLHTCQNKRTENERAIGDGFESFFPDLPTSPARADATRRRMSRDRTVVQRRYDNMRIRGDKGRREKKREGENNANPSTTRYVRCERPPPTGSGTCQTANAG